MTERRPIVVLICGGSCSGKSIFASLFQHALIFSMDHFYYGKSQMKPNKDSIYDFDDPKALDIAGCFQAAKQLILDRRVTVPIYDMCISERVGTQVIKLARGVRFLVVEGIFSFHQPLSRLGDLKIFLDTPTEIRVARRMIRDVEKGRSNLDTLRWSLTVEKNHRRYVEPMKRYADLVVPFSLNPLRFDRAP